ncbi:MAG: hypothetical protein LIP04_10010 [Tannerellaceae bacterium]|nr:hypothetical protein [Tannerellaceae bacterium]
MNVGPRYLYEREDTDDHVTSLHLALRLDYGEPYGDDFFIPRMNGSSSGQHLISFPNNR